MGILGLLYPFPKEVGVDPMFKCKPRYRRTRLKAGRNKAVSRSGLVSAPPVPTHKPHTQFLIIFFHDLVSTYFGGHLMPKHTQGKKVRRNSRLRINDSSPGTSSRMVCSDVASIVARLFEEARSLIAFHVRVTAISLAAGRTQLSGLPSKYQNGVNFFGCAASHISSSCCLGISSYNPYGEFVASFSPVKLHTQSFEWVLYAGRSCSVLLCYAMTMNRPMRR